MGKGYKVITEDGVLHSAGVPATVYGINITSDATAGVVTLRNGSVVGAAAVLVITGTASTSTYHDLGEGVTFPSGCFVDVDANALSVTVVYDVV